MGGLAGERINAYLSLNGYLSVDLKNLPSGLGGTITDFQLALAPLGHWAFDRTELVAGPKLGYWHESLDVSGADSYGGVVTLSGSFDGWVAGLDAGAFRLLNNSVSVGCLIGFDYEKATSCSLSDEQCIVGGPGAKVLSAAVATIF